MTNLEPGRLFTVDCADLPWKPSTFSAGVSVKDVAVAGGMEMQIVRLEAGTTLPVHVHDLPEFLYVLEGSLSIAGQTMGPGWASIASQGSVHADVHSPGGCTFVLVDRPL